MPITKQVLAFAWHKQVLASEDMVKKNIMYKIKIVAVRKTSHICLVSEPKGMGRPIPGHKDLRRGF